MFEVEQIVADHKDVIHDVVFDYYGRRMATCSSDQTVKIWDEDEGGKWNVSASWRAHSGSIWRVSWAHPEFGQLLATCSFDRTTSIWEEVIGEQKLPNPNPLPLSRRWVRRANLVDSRTSVTDVEFSPKYLGLLLATVSTDGTVRIYDAPDIMNLSQWVVIQEVASKLPLSCLSWNTSTYMISQLLAVGSDETTSNNTGKVCLYSYNDSTRKLHKVECIADITDPVTDLAFAPNAGRTFHMLAVASKDLYIVYVRGVSDSTSNAKPNIETFHFTDHKCPVWRVCWNMLATMLISTGDDGCVRVWRMNYKRQWKCAAVLKAEGESPSYEPSATPTTPTFTSSAAATAKYYKKGTISNQVPRH